MRPGLAFALLVVLCLPAAAVASAEQAPATTTAGPPAAPFPVYLLPHFHFDPVWNQPQRGYCEWALEIAQTYVDKCLRDPGFRCILSEWDYLRPLYDTAFDKREALSQLFASGRILPGFSYNQPNDSQIGGEAFLRNLLYGRYLHEDLLGARPTVYLAFDVFGHNVQLPSLCAGAGFSGIISSKQAPGFPQNFWLMGLDGRRLPVKGIPYGVNAGSLPDLLQRVTPIIETDASCGLPSGLSLVGGDWEEAPEYLSSAALAGASDRLTLAFGGLPEAFHFGSAHAPLFSRDPVLMNPAAWVSRDDIKIGNRLAETQLLTAERIATIAALLGARYPDLALDKAWRQVLFVQHHDAIAGTSADTPDLDLLAGLREAAELAAEVTSRALAFVSARVNTEAPPGLGGALPLVVFNPLAWDRQDVACVELPPPPAGTSEWRVFDSTGSSVACESKPSATGRVRVTFLAKTPSFGYGTYFGSPSAPLPQQRPPEPNTIENEFYRITADPWRGGGLSSVFSKSLGRELIAPAAGVPGNALVAMEENQARGWAAWEFAANGRKILSSAQRAEVNVERGPLTSKLIVKGALGSLCSFRQDIALHAGLDRIEFSTYLENLRIPTGADQIIFAAFPNALAGGAPAFEVPFGVVARRRGSGLLQPGTGTDFYGEVALFPAANWIDSSPTLMLESAEGRPLLAPGYTALVLGEESDAPAAAPLLEHALANQGITCTPSLKEPSLAPPAPTFEVRLGRSAFPAGLPESVEATLDRQTAESGYALYLLGPGSLPGLARPMLLIGGNLMQAAQALTDDLRDHRIALPAGSAHGALGSTERAGLALLNTGTLAASEQQDGTLCLFLMHSSLPAQRGLPFHLPLDERTHLFRYALRAHQGDWRDAQVYRSGQDFNYPLVAQVATTHGGILPRDLAFLRVEPANVVLSALKPLGSPAGQLRAAEPMSEGVLLMLSEMCGEPASAKVSFFRGVREAWQTDLVERRLSDLDLGPDGLQFDLSPFSVCSVGFRPAGGGGPAIASEDIGRTSEPLTASPARYWLRNHHAGPLGNQPVAVFLRELPQTRALSNGTVQCSVEAGLINDLDRPQALMAQFRAPEGWTLVPTGFAATVPARGQVIREVQVSYPAGLPGGTLRASTQFGSQAMEDTLELGGPLPLTWNVSRSEDEVLVRLHNPRIEPVEAELTIIGPPETWTPLESGVQALLSASPRMQAVLLEPGGEALARFALRPTIDPSPQVRDSFWLVARLGYNDHVDYRLASTSAPPELSFSGGEAGCLDLRPFFNNDGIGAHSNLWDGAFSGSWESLPAEELPPSEQILLAEGQPFLFPSKADGAPNNVACEKQAIPLQARGAAAQGPWSRLLLLGAAQHNEEGEVEIVYADGSLEACLLRLSDVYGSPAFGETVAVHATHSHTPWGDKANAMSLYVQQLPLDPSKQPAYLTLPDNDDLHVFAMTLAR
jgi:hypothetical protein